MASILYIHWNQREALATVKKLRAAGHTVSFLYDSGKESWAMLRKSPPDLLVVSLARLPSHGRRVAAATKKFKPLRQLPVVFVDGELEKVKTTREEFPSAVYCTAKELIDVLKRPLRKQVAKPRPTTSAGYSGTPLPQKLGIKPGHRVALINAPRGYRQTMGELAEGVKVESIPDNGVAFDLIQFFTKDKTELQKQFGVLAKRLQPAGMLWISWPKKTSGVATDLTEDVVRKIGLEAGLVDTKVCAVDETWSGLRFVIRVKDRK